MASLELYSKVRLDFRAVLEVMDPLTSLLMSYLKNYDFNMKLITPRQTGSFLSPFCILCHQNKTKNVIKDKKGLKRWFTYVKRQ